MVHAVGGLGRQWRANGPCTWLPRTALLVLLNIAQDVQCVADELYPFATYTSVWSNRSSLLEGSAKSCTHHSECGQHEFCFGQVGFGTGRSGVGVCQQFFSETCTEALPCEVNDGDCDTDHDCVSDLVCGTDNCNFIGINRIPHSADCCMLPVPPEWVFGSTETVAELDLDMVATILEDSISNGNFTKLCEEKGFDHFQVLTTFFTESLVDDRFFIDCVMHLTGTLSPDDFSIHIEPHRDYKHFFAVVVAELLGLSYTQVAIDEILNDTSTVTDTGDAAFQNYRRLADSHTIKIYFRVDLGTVGRFFEDHYEVAPKSARSSVSYLRYLQDAERITGKACRAGYMGHDCTERICAYGVSVYSTMFEELDKPHIPGFDSLTGPGYSPVQHAYAECSNAGRCNRKSGECKCFPPYTGKACSRVTCPEDCNGHGQCIPSSFVDGSRPSYTDPVALSTQNWDRYMHHTCVCDRGWEGMACSRKICPRGDYALTFVADEDELSGCDVQEIQFHNFSVGDMFVLRFENFEMDRKTTVPIAFAANASSLALAVKRALEALPNEVIPTVTTAGVESTEANTTVNVIFTDARNTGLQLLLECGTVAEGEYCDAGMQPMMPVSVGSCVIRHTRSEDELNENLECGGRGHCNRQLGKCNCNIGTYGEACELTTDYL